MAITRVQTTAKVSGSAATSIAIPFTTAPTVGNGIVVPLSLRSVSSPSLPTNGCTDNYGNVYTLAVTQGNGLPACGLYVCASVQATGPGFTITVVPSVATGYAACAIEVSIGSSAGLSLDRTAVGSGNSTTPATAATAALTADVFVVGVCAVSNGQTSITVEVVSPTWTQEYEHVSSTQAPGEADSRVLTGASGTTTSVRWTDTNASNWAAAIAAFKAVIVITVPNVVGLTQAAATTAITGAGLTLGTVTPTTSTTVLSGIVISQSPAAGASVANGSPVALAVSSGPPPYTGPKIWTSARSAIGRSDAMRSNWVFPDLNGVVTVNGVDLTAKIRYSTLRVAMSINDQPDTCSFDAFITDAATDAALVVGADVRIGVGGPSSNVIFGGRIVTAQTTRQQGHVPSLRSILCADYLQVLDSEYLITYGWPAQSATTTILDLVARFANRTGGLAVTAANVAPGLPSHQAFGVENEKFSTVMRRMVTMFPTPGGFYIDPFKDLHAWTGTFEPGYTAPTALTLSNFHLKSFAQTADGTQVRDAVIVEGVRTKAPIGTPGAGDYAASPLTFPVEDASIAGTVFDQAGRELRVGSQRYLMRYALGPWVYPLWPANFLPTSTYVTNDVAFNPGAGGDVTVPVNSDLFLQFRGLPCWAKIEEQYLLVKPGTGGNLLKVARVGFGRQTADIKAGQIIAAIDAFSEGTTTGRYDAPGSPETIRAQPPDSDVVMTVRSTAAPAVHENLVQDGRYVTTGATNRGTHEVNDFKTPKILLEFETTDQNARPGRVQAYSFTDPGLAAMAGSYMIISTELYWPVWGELPRRLCTAANVQSADIVDAWLVDQR